MIKISGVSKSFNGQVVLADINLEVKENEILVILGESGTGKSVLLKNMMGLLMPDEGSIFIDSQDITKLSERMLLKIRKGIGYLFQEGALYDFMNVFENVAFPLKEHTDLKQKEILDKVQAVLKEMDLKGIERKFPSELSGGMKKRVALARAIILDSKILFCDEPTSGLDPIRSRDISDLIKNVSKRMGCSTVVTSHDIKNAFRIADRVALIHKGTIIAVGTPSDLESSEDKFVREFIL
ncbi:MAG: ATP-binding cassette domain-containing protein [Candidatus Omnitrophica bacterium]|nr:ATP-binding cassette domain-containing protein [Candidatus Omnitrophota bacterium]